MIGRFINRLANVLMARPPALQVAALCLRETALGTEVLLVRSLDRGNWIVPKGWPMKGRTLAQAAAQEAWEEAGVRGRIIEAASGSYTYGKRGPTGLPQPCRVQVFHLHVETEADTYPESARRARKWVPLTKAARKLAEPELATLVAQLAQDRGSPA
ncbi:MAG: NUDIX hydrolase [Paracoccaceae bacterium]|nr:NUDIX hydrolase [Paracoccaceae bacterium]